MNGQPRRMWLALLIAIALHGILLTLPSPLLKDQAPRRTAFLLTIARPPEKKATPVPAADVSEPPNTESAPGPRPSAGKADLSDIGQHRATHEESTRRQKKSAFPRKGNSVSSDQPVEMHRSESGAKSHSTVFDPRLAAKLSHERNKVQKFASDNTEFMTATGTFIRKDDYCAEIRRLIPSDIDSNVSQHFKIKCTRKQRAQEDIERLARKYGIP